METMAIELKNVTKTFRLKKPKSVSNNPSLRSQNSNSNILVALDNVSFTVPQGKTLGIIGLNGSGKTTLLRTIAGLYKPDAGSIIANGTLAPILNIGTGFNDELIPSENIIMYGMLMGMSKDEIKQKVDGIIEFAELEKFSGTKLKHFSTGMRVRLAFSTALQIESDIFLLDEVLAVGDMMFRKKSFDAFLELKKRGKTILQATHNLKILSEISDQVLLLHQGKVLTIGPPDETIQKYREMNKKTSKKSEE